MGKNILLAFSLALLLSLGCSPASAQNGGGFQGPSAASVSVEHVKGMRDDARVTLQGNIIQQLGDDKYLFKDNTGSITVEIDDKRWNGQTVSPSDRVEIQGKVDKDWNSIEIDVKRITKL